MAWYEVLCLMAATFWLSSFLHYRVMYRRMELLLDRARVRGVIDQTITDRDIPPAHRVEANYWKALYFQQWKETRHLNDALRRMRRRTVPDASLAQQEK